MIINSFEELKAILPNEEITTRLPYIGKKREFTNIEVKSNKVVFYHMNHPRVVSDFIRLVNNNFSQSVIYTLDFSKAQQIFPNVAVPVAGIIAFLKAKGYNFREENKSDLIGHISLLNPQYIHLANQVRMNVVHSFDSCNIYKLVEGYVRLLNEADQFPKGFLSATEWAINEMMDNAINHSNRGFGFIMGQVHKATKHIAFTIFDLGQGIYNSLVNTPYKPQSESEAIELALKESVTRDKDIGQGNGLFGLYSILQKGDSRLKVTSGSGYYSYARNTKSTFNNIPIISEDVKTTTVDFMIDYSLDLSYEDALVFKSKIYTPINRFYENLEEIDGVIRIGIKEQSHGTGTREAARKIKNIVYNQLNEKPTTVILDFTGISVITSSYADELIAKLFCELGLFQFNNLIQVKGLTRENQLILQRSVIQRIIEWSDKESVPNTSPLS